MAGLRKITFGNLFAMLFIGHSLLSGQVLTMKPSIGIASLPADSDSICFIPVYLGNFDASGIQDGDTAADFTLYDLNGDSVNLKDELSNGVPVLLVAGSYTCPVFRGKIPVINQVVQNYASAVKVIVIYEVEAHPDIDISPYFGVVNTTNTNIQAGILYPQPKTYGERKAVCQDLLDSLPINADVVIDGLCNEFWSSYGPAPNNAYLIDTNGIVYSKHGWFHKSPDDIFCDIDSLLGNPANCSSTANGNFTWTFTSSNPHSGPAGTTIYGTGEFKNASGADVNIIMKKVLIDLPAVWSSSICTDVCYPASVDSAAFLLTAGSTQAYTMYFYTSATPVPDTGNIRMRFWNANNMQNNYLQMFTAISDSGSATLHSVLPVSQFRLFPNPASDEVQFRGNPPEEKTSLRISDLSGRSIREMELTGLEGELDLGGLEKGTYLFEARQDGFLPVFGKLLVSD